ncbi:MAG: FliM/FliN family flagellar motor switch protein [Mariprofundaceae bacterium]
MSENTDKSILDPEEVAALMASVAPDEKAQAIFSSLPPLHQPREVTDFHFDQQNNDDGPNNYPLFVTLQERMAEGLTGQWSEIFQREVGVVCGDLSIQNYGDIIHEEDARVFFAYQAEPFGRMMVTCDTQTVIAYVDAMLGGSGEVVGEAAATLSPVEHKLCERIADTIDLQMESQWLPVQKIDFVIYKIETDPQFLSVANTSEDCFSVRFDVDLGLETKGKLYIHYPRAFLEPMLDGLRSVVQDEPVAIDEGWASSLNHAIHDVPLTLCMEMGNCQIDIETFLNMKPGDWLPLKRADNDPVTLSIDSVPVYLAKAGQQNGMLAAEIIENA